MSRAALAWLCWTVGFCLWAAWLAVGPMPGWVFVTGAVIFLLVETVIISRYGKPRRR